MIVVFNHAQVPNQSPSARAALSGDYIPCSFDVIEHACLLISLHEQPSWKYSWLCTALLCIYFSCNYHHRIIRSVNCDQVSLLRQAKSYRFTGPSLFESYHTSLLYARRHICSNP